MHPLEKVMAKADGFLVIGDSAVGRFPATSYDAYVKAGRRFACLDLGGLSASRGPTKGGPVYRSLDHLPDDLGDLAILWVHPKRAAEAVELAHAAGCTRVWFSFKTGHPHAVTRARELGMEVVEVGRCPVYYMANQTPMCRAHTALTRLSGTWARPPSTEADRSRRELV